MSEAAKSSKLDILPIVFAVAAFLLRVPFWSDRPYLVDSIGYCNGAMTTLVAHPPGYIGYCVLGRLGYFLTHNINLSFVIIDTLCISLAAAVIYMLGLEMFGRTQAIIAATLYATSIDTLYCSSVVLSYPVESFLTAVFALASWRALQLKSTNWLLIATFILAISGSVRLTTLAFVFPLWAYVTMRYFPSWKTRLSAVILLAAVVFAWQIPQSQIMARVSGHDYVGSIYTEQGATTMGYDRASLPGESFNFKNEKRFVWPGLELVVASWNHIVAPGASAPEEVRNATLTHSLAHLRTQVCKLAFYTLLAGGLASVLWLLPLFSGSVRSAFAKTPGSATFLLLWITPALLFFALGHFGPWGFLLLYLGALCLICGESLVALLDNLAITPQRHLQIACVATALCAISSLGFFVFARPLPETSQYNKLANLILLQYTAPAVHQHFARVRSGLVYE